MRFSGLGKAGMVVLGPLIVIVGGLTAAVVIGMLIDRASAPPPAPPVPREAAFAKSDLEVRFGGLTTRRMESSERLWVRRRGDGQAVVFESARSNRIIGYVPESSIDAERPHRGGPILARERRPARVVAPARRG